MIDHVAVLVFDVLLDLQIFCTLEGQVYIVMHKLQPRLPRQAAISHVECEELIPDYK
jgi:hypothetical protein